MVEDDSDGQGGGFESLLAASRRAKRELGLAVGHGVEGIQHWVGQRWLPVQLVMTGGFSWMLSRVFGLLIGQVVTYGNRLAALLTSSTVPSTPVKQLLLLFLVVHTIHSGIQTKLILVIKTKVMGMNSKRREEVRADGGGGEFATRLGAIGGTLVGIILGWSFGIDGMFVGAGVGWVLGDDLDGRLEAKVNEPGYAPQEERGHAEK